MTLPVFLYISNAPLLLGVRRAGGFLAVSCVVRATKRVMCGGLVAREQRTEKPTTVVGIGQNLCYIPRPRFFTSTPVVDMQAAKPLFDYPKYWAECFGPAPFLPMSREEMDQLGWDSCDIIIVTGDAYVDHPSFGMAIIGRLLESQGFSNGINAQTNRQTK
ncbi:hypothetical protein ACIP1Y_25025, partial [Pseudomonas atacamensis]